MSCCSRCDSLVDLELELHERLAQFSLCLLGLPTFPPSFPPSRHSPRSGGAEQSEARIRAGAENKEQYCDGNSGSQPFRLA
jgi:hypothetical protein